MNLAYLRIAGRLFHLHASDPESAFDLPGIYDPFLEASPSTGDHVAGSYRIHAHEAWQPTPIQGIPLWRSDIWDLGKNADDDRLTLSIHTADERPAVPVASVSRDFAAADLRQTVGRKAEPSAHGLNYPTDQVILMTRLLLTGALVLHAAGIVYEGKGYLFFGPSGAGKTTISRLWARSGASLINDDRVAVYRDKGVWTVTATPWHGEDPRVHNIHVPLHGVYHLIQDDVNDIHPVPSAHMLARLTSCAMIPFYNGEAVDEAMAMLESLLVSVPAGDLSFTPDRRVVDALLRHPHF